MDQRKHALWAEKYRPKTFNEYVFQSDKQKSAFTSIVEQQALAGHLLLSGVQGSGKTTMAEMLISLLNVDPLDVLIVHASDDNSVDHMRDTIKSFIDTFPVGAFKVVLLEEADYMSHNAQAVLRKYLENEQNPARFILTCNYDNKLMPAIRSRCQHYRFAAADKEDITEFAANVLISEGIKFNLDLLDDYVAASYPDIRATLNTIQQSSMTGTLLPLINEHTAGDYKFELLPLLQQGNWVACRKLLCDNVQAEEWESVYTFLYENIDKCPTFSVSSMWDEAIIIIAEHLYKHAIVADPEINAAAMFARLSQLK